MTHRQISCLHRMFHRITALLTVCLAFLATPGGATDEEITDLVRGKQAQLLFGLCYLLEDPCELEPEVADMGWALMQIDEEDNILDHIGGLHESVLQTDPTGREMRPRGWRG